MVCIRPRRLSCSCVLDYFSCGLSLSKCRVFLVVVLFVVFLLPAVLVETKFFFPSSHLSGRLVAFLYVVFANIAQGKDLECTRQARLCSLGVCNNTCKSCSMAV